MFKKIWSKSVIAAKPEIECNKFFLLKNSEPIRNSEAGWNCLSNQSHQVVRTNSKKNWDKFAISTKPEIAKNSCYSKNLELIGNSGSGPDCPNSHGWFILSSKKIWRQYIIATGPEIQSNKFLLLKQCITIRKQRICLRLLIQPITGGLYWV